MTSHKNMNAVKNIEERKIFIVNFSNVFVDFQSPETQGTSQPIRSGLGGPSSSPRTDTSMYNLGAATPSQANLNFSALSIKNTPSTLNQTAMSHKYPSNNRYYQKCIMKKMQINFNFREFASFRINPHCRYQKAGETQRLETLIYFFTKKSKLHKSDELRLEIIILICKKAPAGHSIIYALGFPSSIIEGYLHLYSAQLITTSLHRL